MRRKGEISVFLTLLLTVISGFIITLVTYAKGYVSKCEATLAMDSAIRSCFAEYNKKMFEKYHILLIDSSYKSAENGSGRTLEHFSVYLNNSISKSIVCDTRITGISRVSEDDCEYIYRQAAEYERKKTGTDADRIYEDDAGYFYDYLREVSGYYGNPGEGSVREGELEYLIFGADSDRDNIDQALSGYEDIRESEGISYGEYLIRKLEAEDTDVLKQRFLGLIEENIRENGSPGFDISECYYSMTFMAELESSAGEYSITRTYGYGSDET